jgi:hypothetical protein
MGKKFRQILEGPHRNHIRIQMAESTAYLVIHDICTDKLLTPTEKVQLIDGFCQNTLTVEDISKHLKNESMSSF